LPRSYKLTPAQLALAWLLAQRDVIAIPQSSSVSHVAECRAAADVRLPAEALAAIDAAFPPPQRRAPARDVVIRTEREIASLSAPPRFVRHK
jgi:aryl-alcohol dehydrogenase-like predicted oxidoreductase